MVGINIPNLWYRYHKCITNLGFLPSKIRSAEYGGTAQPKNPDAGANNIHQEATGL
jgi:hypothetical protein